MSISLLGLAIGIIASPAILVAREVMGHEEFDTRINANKLNCTADFKNVNEWKKIVTDSGYDIAKIKGLYKTHYSTKKDDFFFWELSDNKFVAEFYKSDKEKYQKFIAAVEKTAGRKIFTFDNDESLSEDRQRKKINEPKRVDEVKKTSKAKTESETELPTIYTDLGMLLKTLDEYSVSYSVNNGTVSVHFNGYDFLFKKDSEEAPFTLTIMNGSENNALSFIEFFNTAYTKTAQEQAYITIKENCKQSEYEIIDEEVLEDNSIVLTISV